MAHLKPVLVGGVYVERVTLHNEDEINRLGLVMGRSKNRISNNENITSSVNNSYDNENKNDFNIEEDYILFPRVMVKRAGDVIPKITRVVSTMTDKSKNMDGCDIDDKEVTRISDSGIISNPEKISLLIVNDSVRTENAVSTKDVSTTDMSTSDVTQTVLYRLPANCPACGSMTEREDGGILVRCTAGFNCNAQVRYMQNNMMQYSMA